MKHMRTSTWWAIEWRSTNLLDGKQRWYIGAPNLPTPQLYRTRAEARHIIQRDYGYIARRSDLRAEPHGWRMPRAVKVQIVVRRVA